MLHLTSIGTLGRDAEVREHNGRKVINFSIACNTGYGENKKTSWIECSRWTEKDSISQYLKKGTKVMIMGELGLRQWEKDGKSGASITCNVSNLQLLGGRSEDGVTAKELPVLATKEELKSLPF